LVHEVVDRVRTAGRLEQTVAVELAGSSEQRELTREQLIEALRIVALHGTDEFMRELDELVHDGGRNAHDHLQEDPARPIPADRTSAASRSSRRCPAVSQPVRSAPPLRETERRSRASPPAPSRHEPRPAAAPDGSAAHRAARPATPPPRARS